MSGHQQHNRNDVGEKHYTHDINLNTCARVTLKLLFSIGTKRKTSQNLIQALQAISLRMNFISSYGGF